MHDDDPPVSFDVIHWASLLYPFLFHQIKNRGNARFSDSANDSDLLL